MKNIFARTCLGVAVAALTGLGCGKNIDTTRQPDSYTTFGDAVYRESCERLAYIGELEQQEAGQRTTVDVSGSLGNSVCIAGVPAPADAPPKLPAIQGQRALFTSTVDAVFPSPFLPDLQGFMIDILPLQDDNTVPKNVAALGTLFQQMKDDPDFPGALERLGIRAGYRPGKVAAGVAHTVVNYPQIDDFLGQVLGMIATGGSAATEWNQVVAALGAELRAATPSATVADPERTITLALNLMLQTSSDLADGTPRPLTARDYRGVAIGNLKAAGSPFVDMNGDGLADTDGAGNYVDANGAIIQLPTPFIEPGKTDSAPRDAQGRVLVTAGGSDLLYNYLDLDGTVVGGLTREALTLMDPTKDTTLGLVFGAAQLLGPRMMQQKQYTDPATGQPSETLSFNGYDTSQSAALDLAHAFIQVLGDPTPKEADQTLEGARTLLSDHESETSRVIKAMFDAHDLGKQHPEAAIPVNSVLYDQMAPIIARILRVPGLAQRLVTALQDPHVAGLAPMMARLVRSRNQIDFDHTDDNGNGGKNYATDPHALDAEDYVDRTMPDVDYNRSLLQRIAHLIHDANGLQFCNKDGATVKVLGITLESKAACQLFKVNDLSLFFILAMASDSVKQDTSTAERTITTHNVASFREAITDSTMHALVLDDGVGDDTIQLLVGINNFTRFPTPQAASRALFLSPAEESSFLQNTIVPVPCTDGDTFIDVHNKSIFAWETTLPANPAGAAYANDTFYDAFRPVVDAFASFDECLDATPSDICQHPQNAAKILVDLLSLLHEHWTSPQGSYFGHTYQSTSPSQPRFSYPDSVVSYEPLLNLVLGGDMVPSLQALAPVLQNLNLPSTGTSALPPLFGAARYVFDPQMAPASLAYRSGATTTVWSDGTTKVPQVTPYYLLADAYAHKRAALAATSNTMAAQSWATSTSALIDELLTVTSLGNNKFQLQNRRMHAITLLIVDFLRGRLESHATAQDLDTWVHHTLTQNLTDTMSGPLFASLTDFVSQVETNPTARTSLYSLLQYLVDEATNDAGFQTALTSLADSVQLFVDDPDLVPVAHVIGKAMDPAQGLVPMAIDFVKRGRDLDTKKALLTILRNVYQPDATGAYPASNLADLLSTINRATPGSNGPLLALDYQTMFGQFNQFLTDEQRGLPRFLAIIRNRGSKLVP